MASRLLEIIHNFLGERNFNNWKIKSEKWRDSTVTLPKKVKAGGDVHITTNIFRTEKPVSDISKEIIENEGIFVSEDLVNIENMMLNETADDRELLKDFELYCESQHYDALRLAIASQKLHEAGSDDESIKIVDKIRRKFGSEGNAVYNLYISSVLKNVVIFSLKWYKIQISDDNNIKARFLPEFKSLLQDYDYAIFVGVSKSVPMIVEEIKEKYRHRVNHLSIYSRESTHNEKVNQALKEYQEDPNNPKLKIEEFGNEYFRIENAQNYRIYFLDRISGKLSRRARKRFKKARKRRKKEK